MRMPTLFRSLLLGALIGLPWLASAAEEVDQSEQAVVPEVKRLDLRAPRFASNDFELGAVFGGYFMRYYYQSKIYGLRANYYINEDVYLHLAYDNTTISSNRLRLIAPGCVNPTGATCSYVPNSSERAWTATTAGIGLSGLLPGEVYVFGKYSFLTSGYVFGGLGKVNFDGKSEKAFTVGGGTRTYLTNWLVLNSEVRNYVYTIDKSRTVGYYNPKSTYRKGVVSGQASIGLSVIF
jgi:outer membrane beta-barrel protein